MVQQLICIHFHSNKLTFFQRVKIFFAKMVQGFVPFKAAALLPLTQIHNHAKQDKGYRWPHIALGRLVSCVLCDSIPLYWLVGLSVHPSIHQSVCQSICHTLLFWRFWGFWPHCSGPNAPLTSNMAPAHPHATGLAVYSALFVLFSVLAITDETC